MNSVVGLSLRARKTLAFLGVTTKDELNRCSDSDLLKFRGCGRKTLCELREWAGWREYQEREVIADKCRKAHRFLVSHGYTVILPNSPLCVQVNTP